MNATSDQRQDAGSAAAAARERAEAEASRTAHDIRHQGEEMAASAKARAREFAARQKEAGAEHVDTVARAVNKAAEELERSSPEVARYTRQFASSMSGVSDALRQRSVGDLFHDANQFARREPVALFGAAIVAGFALVRFFESSARHDTHETGNADQAGGLDQATQWRQP